MAGVTFTISANPFLDLIQKLESQGKDEIIKQSVDIGLKKGADVAIEKIEKSLVHENMPAKGKYSKGKHKRKIIKGQKVKWNGSTASIRIGIESKGIDPVGTQVLIYGSPRQKPVVGLFEAVYGEKALIEAEKVAVEDITKRLTEYLNGEG